jgi:putative endonuclease
MNWPKSAYEKGRKAENLVCEWLSSKNWEIIAQNWRAGLGRRGEIDIIAHFEDTISFIEVKETGYSGFESLENLVGQTKQRRIIETSKLFLSLHREFNQMVVRYDIASVINGNTINYLENAFMERL